MLCCGDVGSDDAPISAVCLSFFFFWRVRSFFVFFFSSRRRHTRLVSDWSSDVCSSDLHRAGRDPRQRRGPRDRAVPRRRRSEEHTSELQSLTNLVCRLLLEKKKKICILYNNKKKKKTTEKSKNV